MRKKTRPEKGSRKHRAVQGGVRCVGLRVPVFPSHTVELEDVSNQFALSPASRVPKEE